MSTWCCLVGGRSAEPGELRQPWAQPAQPQRAPVTLGGQSQELSMGASPGAPLEDQQLTASWGVGVERRQCRWGAW